MCCIQLARIVLANYVAEVLLTLPKLIGSLNVLGNPTAMLSRILNVFRETKHHKSIALVGTLGAATNTLFDSSVSRKNLQKKKQLPSIWQSGYFLSKISSLGR